MVAEPAGENSFKIGLLVFEMLLIKIFECNISFNFNPIQIVFFVINGKTFSDHVPEKIF